MQHDRLKFETKAETRKHSARRDRHGFHRSGDLVTDRYWDREDVVITAFEQTAPEKITYKRGACLVELTGANASLYRAMIWQYGESAATEKFWWLWHKKGSPDKLVAQ